MPLVKHRARPSRRMVLCLCSALACGPLLAQESFPSRRIEIIVPFPAGGTADFLGRLVGQKLGESWGQQVVVNNKPGAAGALGAESAAQAAPDGHTLLITSYTNRKMLFTPEAPVADPARDLVPVALLTKPPLVPQTAHSIPDLIADAKEKCGRPGVASGPCGSGPRLGAQLVDVGDLFRLGETWPAAIRFELAG